MPLPTASARTRILLLVGAARAEARSSNCSRSTELIVRFFCAAAHQQLKTQHGQVDRDGDVREASSWAETARAQGNVFPSAKREPIPDASPTTSSTVEDSFMVNNSPNDMVMLSEVHGLDYSAPRGDVVQIEEQA